jgi:hypothetical protein
VLAVLVSSTTTQTVTSYITLTGTGQTTQYGTFTQLSSLQTVTGTTYTTTGVTTVLVQVLTTVIHPVFVTSVSASQTCGPSGCFGYAKTYIITYYSPEVGYMMGYSRSTVVGAVTSQYVTNVPTTVLSTSASTSTYSTGQVATITATQTLTSVSEQAGPSISDMLSQNLWIVLVLFAVVLGVLGFWFGRRGGRGPSVVSPPTASAESVQGPKPGIVYCQNCGTQNPATNEFCGKCGTKL